MTHPTDFRSLCAELCHIWSRTTNPDDLYENLPPLIDRARAVLTRYGAQAVPVPVAERLPGEGDCNSEGEVWIESPGLSYAIGDTGDYDWEPAKWELRQYDEYDAKQLNRRWLPHWALPLPEAQP